MEKVVQKAEGALNCKYKSRDLYPRLRFTSTRDSREEAGNLLHA